MGRFRYTVLSPMPILKYRKSTLEPLSRLVPEISYVMCGARGESSSKLMRALPQTRFYGFEVRGGPGRGRAASSVGRAQLKYFPVAVGGQKGTRTLYVTGHPACSSLIAPNEELLKPFLAAPRMRFAKETTLEVAALDEYLPAAGVSRIDFLDLDTQGSEFEILQGAKQLLGAGTAVVKSEVELSPMYRDQPLFADVDRYLREAGFLLFDLRRSRYRRTALPAQALTRGQLLCGDAWWLRDYRLLGAAGQKERLFTLCLLAAQLQFHDYALEILEYSGGDSALSLTPEEKDAVEKTREQYLRDLARGARWNKVLGAAFSIGLAAPIKEVGRLASQVGDRLKTDHDMTEPNWED